MFLYVEMNRGPRFCPVRNRRCPSQTAFGRHLLHHDLTVVASGRGPRRTETLRRLDPEEAEYRRTLAACRQGGRREQRRRLRDERHGPRPSATKPRLPETSTAQQPQPVAPAEADVTNYRPAGYASSTPTLVSSISSGGLTNDTDFSSASSTGWYTFLELSSISASGRPMSPSEFLQPLARIDMEVQTDVPNRDVAVDVRHRAAVAASVP